MKIRLALLILLFFSFFTQAEEQPKSFDRLINTLVNCDADFFNVLEQSKTELSPYVEITSIDAARAYIQVENRAKTKDNLKLFNTPINYKSLSFIGYYDSALKLDKYGNYYFWGFVIDGEIENIKNTLNMVDWHSMEENNLYIANPKILFTDNPKNTWQNNDQVVVGVKTMPSQNTAEKLLLLENSKEQVLLVCSIQGFLPEELIKIERPDLDDNHINQNKLN
ncbi:hypothetical protein RCS94_09680 [Orbaceae bacterium ac157xtp]